MKSVYVGLPCLHSGDSFDVWPYPDSKTQTLDGLTSTLNSPTKLRTVAGGKNSNKLHTTVSWSMKEAVGEYSLS